MCDGVDLKSDLVQLTVNFVSAYQAKHSVLPDAVAIEQFVQHQLRGVYSQFVSRGYWSIRIMVLVIIASMIPATNAWWDYPAYYTERHIDADIRRHRDASPTHLDEGTRAEIGMWMTRQ